MNQFEIIAYEDKLSRAFENLWVPWLRQMTGNEPEESDLAAVTNPRDYYIDAGGAVFFALLETKPVGVIAVKRLTPDSYEFCKLVVLENARGFGLGRSLVERCIEFVKSKKGSALYLQSFKKLEVAVNMYRKMGFIPCPAPEGMQVVKRTEIIMKMVFKFAP